MSQSVAAIAWAAGGFASSGPGAGEQGHRDLEPGKDPVEPPPADPRAVFEHALGGEVAAIAGIGAGALDQPGFADPVARRMRQLRAFLEIDHEIDRDPRVVGPARMRRLGAVADKIPGHFGSCGGSGYQPQCRIWSSVYGHSSGRAAAAASSPYSRKPRSACSRASSYRELSASSASRRSVGESFFLSVPRASATDRIQPYRGRSDGECASFKKCSNT